MEKKNKVVSLVLAGGGALGSYEVGAIQALEELGYSFNIVTGTSIGALNAAFVKARDTNRLYDLWSNITAEKVMVNGIDFTSKFITNPSGSGAKDMAKWANVYIKGDTLGADITPFKEYIRNSVNVEKAMASDIKMGIVTSKLPFFTRVDVDMDKVSKENFLPFLHASSACAPVFPKEKIDGVSYVDGFYNDNLPIRLAFEYGAKDVIAVDMRLFSLTPPNAFYLTLPNVEYIAPYIKSLGNMMDFSQPTIQKNIKLGYLDTMKHFKVIRGYKYAFRDIPECKGFVAEFLKEYDTDSKYIIAKLSDGIRTPMDEIDYFVSTIELIADRLKLENYYELYDLESFAVLIREKAREAYARLAEKAENQDKLSRFLDRFTDDLESKRKKVVNRYLLNFACKYLNLTKEDGETPILPEDFFFPRVGDVAE